MPLYFFHLHECGIGLDDPEGTELANLEAARSHATANARSIMAAEVLEGRLCLSDYIDISTHAGELLSTVWFRDALRLTGLR